MLPETPCTQFAHNLWKVVIINDKRDTPVNDILFLSASSIDKEFSQIYAHDEAFTYNLHKRIIRKEISYTPVVIPFVRNKIKREVCTSQFSCFHVS